MSLIARISFLPPSKPTRLPASSGDGSDEVAAETETNDSPEDLLSSALGVIFPDDVTNQHGDEEHTLLAYTSPYNPRPIRLRLSRPGGDDQRRLFGHYLWNSSLLLAELVEAGSLLAAAGSGAGGRDDVVGEQQRTAAMGSDVGGSSPAAPSRHISRLPDLTDLKETYQRGDVSRRDDQPPHSTAHHRRPPPPWPVTAFAATGCSLLELGAGTALPSIVAAQLGASRVAVSDFPAESLLGALAENVRANAGDDGDAYPGFVPTPAARVSVEGHVWGDLGTPAVGGGVVASASEIARLAETKAALPAELAAASTSFALRNAHAFDRVVAADCLWMPWEHTNLRRSIGHFLALEETAGCDDPDSGGPAGSIATTDAAVHDSQTDDAQPPEPSPVFSPSYPRHLPQPTVVPPSFCSTITTADNVATYPSTPPLGPRAWIVAGFHTGRAKLGGFFDADSLRTDAGLEVEVIWEQDCDGQVRPWAWDRGSEDPTELKRWHVVAVLRRVRDVERTRD